MRQPSGESILRGLAGILVGVAVMGVLLGLLEQLASSSLHWGPNSPSGPVFARLLADFIAAMAGGFVCAFIARNPKVSMILAVLILVSALVYQFRPGEPGEPTWYRLALILIAPGGVFWGGWLRGV